MYLAMNDPVLDEYQEEAKRQALAVSAAHSALPWWSRWLDSADAVERVHAIWRECIAKTEARMSRMNQAESRRRAVLLAEVSIPEAKSEDHVPKGSKLSPITNTDHITPPLNLDLIGRFLKETCERGPQTKRAYLTGVGLKRFVKKHPDLAKKVAGFCDPRTGKFSPITDEEIAAILESPEE